MPHRPQAVAFDVIETLFPLEPLRARIIAAGLPGATLESWFDRLLRDAFALTAATDYRPFADVAASALRSVADHDLPDEATHAITAGFAELDPHPEAAEALRRSRAADIPVITLTNGSPDTTRTLLERAGLSENVRHILSVDDIHRWKPAPEIYLHAATTCGLEPGRVALVAAHPWDIHGAHRAGLITGFVHRTESAYPAVFARPDVAGADLVEVVDALLALPCEE